MYIYIYIYIYINIYQKTKNNKPPSSVCVNKALYEKFTYTAEI